MKTQRSLLVKEDFVQVAMEMPKLKPQYITPKLAYLARTKTTDIVVKISRHCKIVIKSDGTWDQLV